MDLSKLTPCQTEGCKKVAHELSWFDTAGSPDKKGIVKIDRLVKYKCLSGHITEIHKKLVKNMFARPHVEPGIPSVKRYHRKGYQGHIVQDYSHQREDAHQDPLLTNHERMLARAAVV